MAGSPVESRGGLRHGARFALAARLAVGAVLGLVVYLVSAVTTGLNVLVHPSVAARATGGDTLDMLFYLLLFPAAGALIGALSRWRPRALRYPLIGAIAGALVWTYLTDTWTLTARAWAPFPPQTTLAEAIVIGAALGATGGLLLFALVIVRPSRD